MNGTSNGCEVSLIDPEGMVLDNKTIYINSSATVIINEFDNQTKKENELSN